MLLYLLFIFNTRLPLSKGDKVHKIFSYLLQFSSIYFDHFIKKLAKHTTILTMYKIGLYPKKFNKIL